MNFIGAAAATYLYVPLKAGVYFKLSDARFQLLGQAAANVRVKAHYRV